jgi:hypothetical protein
MATYKVLQDIEAEDKLVGPLTLRQFIYAAVTAICLYICFLLVTKGAPFFTVIFLPPAIVSGFFAFPWGREQPTEIWALAKIRFMIKPRKRIWDQSGVKELVTVTAPKKVELVYTNNMSQTEVSSRLHALADTIDSRGWAIKNVQTGLPMAQVAEPNPADSDRLISVNILPQVQPLADVPAASDMLDEQNSPIARQFDQMIKQSTAQHHERVMQEISQAQAIGSQPQQPVAPAAARPTSTPPNDYWFLNQASASSPTQTVHPGTTPAAVSAAQPTPEEVALAQQLKEQNKESIQISYGHMRTIQPISNQPKVPAQGTAHPASNATNAQTSDATKSATPPVTRQPNPATLKYVNNDDLTVATIARQVNENPPDEIVISLH